MTVNNIFEFLDKHFPTNTALDFDNVGLLIGDPNKEIKKVLIALDCTKDTINQAVENGCELIITHHPVIFSPLKNILSDSIAYSLIKNDIAVISMHTNLDVCENGVNDCLAKTIGLTQITPYLASDGYILKSGVVSYKNSESFSKHLSKALNVVVKYIDGGKPIEKVLVCSGSGGDFIEEAINGGFDALVTSDIKHHHFLQAKDHGVSLFDAGHYQTEDIIVEELKNLLANKFYTLEFFTYHPDIIKFAYNEN